MIRNSLSKYILNLKIVLNCSPRKFVPLTSLSKLLPAQSASNFAFQIRPPRLAGNLMRGCLQTNTFFICEPDLLKILPHCIQAAHHVA